MLKQREVETKRVENKRVENKRVEKKRVENKRVERLFFSPDQNTSVRLHSKIKKTIKFYCEKKIQKAGRREK